MRFAVSLASVGLLILLLACSSPLPRPVATSPNKPPGEQSAPEHLALEKPPDDQFLKQNDSAKLGDVSVEIDGAKLEFVQLASVPLRLPGGLSQSATKYLVITIELSNTSLTKKLNYNPWQSPLQGHSPTFATMHDDKGNKYKRVGFGLSERPIGQVERMTSIYPGKQLKDVLVFEAPVEAAEYLVLNLPGDAVEGGKGELRYKILTSSLTQ